MQTAAERHDSLKASLNENDVVDPMLFEETLAQDPPTVVYVVGTRPSGSSFAAILRLDS